MQDNETKYGWSKLKLYILMKALVYFWTDVTGLKNLIVEVNASNIKGMLYNPDLHPLAIINHWISNIKEYDFHQVHVPASNVTHGDSMYIYVNI